MSQQMAASWNWCDTCQDNSWSWCETSQDNFPPLSFIIKIYTALGARKMVKCLRAIVALAKELGSVPITHMVAYSFYNSSSRALKTPSFDGYQTCTWCTHTQISNKNEIHNIFDACSFTAQPLVFQSVVSDSSAKAFSQVVPLGFNAALATGVSTQPLYKPEQSTW